MTPFVTVNGAVISKPEPPPRALTLADLSHDAWTVIGYNRRNEYGLNTWDYLLDRHNISAMFLARENGAVITGQRKLPDGRFELRARLARRRP